MKILERNHLVGLGYGFAVVRDLILTNDGTRESIRKSAVFAVVREDKGASAETLLSKYPLTK